MGCLAQRASDRANRTMKYAWFNVVLESRISSFLGDSFIITAYLPSRRPADFVFERPI